MKLNHGLLLILRLQHLYPTFYIPRSSYKTFITKRHEARSCLIYIPLGSYKTSTKYQAAFLLDKFISHLVHIKQDWKEFFRQASWFISHLVHIKPVKVDKGVHNNENIYIPLSSYKTTFWIEKDSYIYNIIDLYPT